LGGWDAKRLGRRMSDEEAWRVGHELEAKGFDFTQYAQQQVAGDIRKRAEAAGYVDLNTGRTFANDPTVASEIAKAADKLIHAAETINDAFSTPPAMDGAPQEPASKP
jgi:hypothetical protein